MTDSILRFQWVGLDSTGHRVTGIIKAAGTKEAEEELRKKNIAVIQLKKIKNNNINLFWKTVSQRDVTLFTRSLSTMLHAGLSISQALEVISRDQKNPAMQAMLISLKSNIASGKSLAETFGQYEKSFGPLYCGLLKTAEQSGTLDQVLNHLSNYLEKTQSTIKKVKKAFIYPAAVTTVGIGVALILLIYVVPQFKELFESTGGKLPALTQDVVDLSAFLRQYWWLVFIVLAGFIIGLYSMFRLSTTACALRDRAILRIPVMGPIFRKGIIARFTRTLAITLGAGLPISDALKSMIPIMGNSLYCRAMHQIQQEVITGQPLASAIENTGLFPNIVIQLINIGEVSGKLVEMLDRLATIYEDEVSQAVDVISTLIEPMVLVMLAVIVGGFIVAMYMPIFTLGTTIH